MNPSGADIKKLSKELSDATYEIKTIRRNISSELINANSWWKGTYYIALKKERLELDNDMLKIVMSLEELNRELIRLAKSLDNYKINKKR